MLKSSFLTQISRSETIGRQSEVSSVHPQPRYKNRQKAEIKSENK